MNVRRCKRVHMRRRMYSHTEMNVFARYTLHLDGTVCDFFKSLTKMHFHDKMIWLIIRIHLHLLEIRCFCKSTVHTFRMINLHCTCTVPRLYWWLTCTNYMYLAECNALFMSGSDPTEGCVSQCEHRNWIEFEDKVRDEVSFLLKLFLFAFLCEAWQL